MEFIHRSKKATVLKVGQDLMGYPIVNQYKYLGTWLDQKLTMDTQLQHINKKAYFIRHRLSPTLYNSSLDFRRNLWQVFVLPLFEFILPPYSYEEAESAKKKVELSLRKTFKCFTGLKKMVRTDLTNDLMAYNIQDRSSLLTYLCEQKWQYRLRGLYYAPDQDPNLERPKRMPNVCKNQPKAMIKYINMQTALCPACSRAKNNKTPVTAKARCSPDHLRQLHNIKIDSISSIMKEVKRLTETQKHNKKNKNKLTRKQILQMAESLIEPHISRLKAFLSLGTN